MTLAALLRAAGRPPLLWGHRGTRRGAPENTVRAFRRAIDQGADGIELDVRRCASGEVVVIHDENLSRVAGDPARVIDLDLESLRSFDLGEGEHVPLLDEACDVVLGAGLWLNVELKTDGEDLEALVAGVAEVLARRTPADRGRVVISSFGREAVELARRRMAPITTAFLFSRAPLTSIECDGVHPRYSCASAARIARWRDAGKFVNAWTVNDGSVARALVEAGVDGLITDDIPAIREALGSS